MIYLHQIAHNDFTLFDAGQLTSQALDVVRRLRPASIVVRYRQGSSVSHYLYSLNEFLAQSTSGDSGRPLREALNLAEQRATPAVDPYTDAETAPLRCVAAFNDHVTGVYDASLPIEDYEKGEMLSGTPKGGSDTTASFLVLQAEFPEKVILGQTASLVIGLMLPGDEKSGVSLAAAANKPVDVIVQALQGFALQGAAEGKLSIAPQNSQRIEFKLKATEFGPGRIRVLFFQAGQPLGALTLAASVAADPGQERIHESDHLSPGSLVVNQPDLTLVVLEQGHRGQPEITLRLTAADPALGLNWKPYGPIKLRMDPLQYFQDFFHDIEGLPVRTAEEQAIAERKLALKGARLFQDLLPEELRNLLWGLRSSIQSVHILSDEPWIPWELLRQQGRENGRAVEGSFFCEAYAMTRWFLGIGRRPEIHLKKIALVAPSDSGLPMATQERECLLSFANDRRQVQEIPANYLSVIESLSQGEYDGWHFTGHGQFVSPDPNRSPILLERNQLLCAAEICGRVSNCGISQPLVFLNACQTGRQALSLTGMGSWARSFIDAGAAGFVGSLWSVYDDAASQFAGEFYRRLFAGQAVGQAVREARLAIRPLNNPSRLAYTVFADPLAAVH